MNLVSIGASCPACGDAKYERELKACSSECVRSGARGYIDGSSYGSSVAPVHLHVACRACRFQWIAPLHNADVVKQAW